MNICLMLLHTFVLWPQHDHDHNHDRAADPNLRQQFERTLAAAEKARTISYEAHCFGTGPLEEIMVPIKGSVVCRLLTVDDPIGATLSVTGGRGKDGSRDRFHLIYDGQQLAIRSDSDGKVVLGDPRKESALLSRPEMKLVLREILPRDRLFQPLHASKLAGEGDQEVEGTICHVIAVEYESPTSRRLPAESIMRKVYRSRWFLGEKDALPRRVEFRSLPIPGLSGAEADKGTALILSEVKIDSPARDDLFRIPESWLAERGAPAQAPTKEPGDTQPAPDKPGGPRD